ncbi:DUF1554 domain-containing protein [Leptospira ellisii]|nr:DUF1554 domain-containing protein [Leptospira ellisii]MDV6234502.1 DUF1554 domain-containing protein [Leptospira ellisii]
MKKIPTYIVSFLLVAFSFACSDSKDSNETDLFALLLLNPSTSPLFSPGYKVVFVTNDPHDGDFGGVSGADTFCNAQKPAGAPIGATFKALLVSEHGGVGNTRLASRTTDANFNGLGDGQVDWVLSANTEYRRIDGTTVVFQTNERRLFDFFPNNRLQNPFTDTNGLEIWTGLNPDWSVANSCVDWTSNTAGGGDIGEIGFPDESDAGSVHLVAKNCDETARLLCVQQ